VQYAPKQVHLSLLKDDLMHTYAVAIDEAKEYSVPGVKKL